MTSRDVLLEQIAQEANKNIHVPIVQLENAFFESLIQIDAETRLPTRDDDDDSFWRGFMRDLAQRIIRNRDPALLTIGMITSDVIKAIEPLGYDIGVYRYPVSLLIAIVAKTIWDRLEKPK